jgi:hypothetical protein
MDLGYHTMVTTTESPPPPEPPCSIVVKLDTHKFKATFKTGCFESVFDWLSDDLVLRILNFLPTNTLCICARVSRRFYFLAWEPELWTSINLSVSNCDQTLGTLLRLLSRDSTCQAVETLSLNNCSGLTDTGLDMVTQKCPRLTNLELRNCKGVSNGGVQRLLTKCLNLTQLDLSGKTFLNFPPFLNRRTLTFMGSSSSQLTQYQLAR